MSTRQALTEVIDSLPEDRMAQVLAFARFVLEQEDREDWRHFGRQQLVRAYGEDEPEYTEADIKSDL